MPYILRIYIYIYIYIYNCFGSRQPYMWLVLARTIYIRCFLAGKSPNIRSYTVYIYGVFWLGNHQIYGRIRCIYTVFFGWEITKYTVVYGVYIRCFWAGKSPNIRSYTVYIYGVFWLGNHQIYGRIRRIYTVFFGWEITKYTVVYGVYIRCFLAGKSPNIRSYTAYIYGVFWLGNHQIYGRIRRIYTVFFGWEITKYTVIYGVYIRCFLAGKSPNIRSYTAYIYGSGQPYKWYIPAI